jgi:hypothetical protein
MKVEALDGRRNEPALRVAAKQEQCGVVRGVAVEEVQVRERIGEGSARRQGVSSRVSSPGKERIDLAGNEVGHGGPGAAAASNGTMRSMPRRAS